MQEKVINGHTVRYQMGRKDAGIVTFYASFDEENLPFLFENLKDVTIYALKIEDWNFELSPWKAPAVYGNEDFGDGAKKTLSFIIDKILPEMGCEKYIIGGYSLAGLFSLWACYSCDAFIGCASSSSSLWFPGWDEFVKENEFKGKYAYLSLGKKEHRTKNQIMSSVKDRVEMQYDVLRKELGEDNCILEWNEGGHFNDVKERMLKSFKWWQRRIIVVKRIHHNLI